MPVDGFPSRTPSIAGESSTTVSSFFSLFKRCNAEPLNPSQSAATWVWIGIVRLLVCWLVCLFVFFSRRICRFLAAAAIVAP